MGRGEVWWARLSQPIGIRPVLLLSRDDAYAVRQKVTLAPITTRKRGLSTEVSLGTHEGMPKACVIDLDSLATIDKDSLTDRICRLSSEKMDQVHQAIKFALDLP